MAGTDVEGSGRDAAALTKELERGAREADPAEVEAADARLDELLDKVATQPSSSEEEAVPEPAAADTPALLPQVTLATGRPRSLQGRQLSLEVQGRVFTAALAPEVSADVVRAAIKNRDRVLLQQAAGEEAEVVGVVQTSTPDEIVLKARKIHVEGESEVLLRSGRGAMRLRQDGDVELVGSRISAMSRGLFRLVGRVLRLN